MTPARRYARWDTAVVADDADSVAWRRKSQSWEEMESENWKKFPASRRQVKREALVKSPDAGEKKAGRESDEGEAGGDWTLVT